MTPRGGHGAYAPFALTTVPAELGLDEFTVTSELGTAVAHYRRTSGVPGVPGTPGTPGTSGTPGSTRATILLHGAAGSWTTWTPLLQAAAASGVRIRNPILIDLPGWGAATLTDRGEQVAIEAVCTLVKDCAEQLGYTEWDIVGHSMGGFIALHMASIWPKSVRTVGIVSGTGRSIIRSVEHPVRNFGVLPAFTLLWRAMIVLAALGPAGPRLIRWLRSAGLLRPVVSPLFRHARRIDRSVIDALGDELRPRPFVLAAEIARGYDADGRWARIECPVRALNGDRDVFSTRGDLDQLARTVHATVLTVIDDCGHFAAVERPGEVLVALGFTAGEQGSPTACAGPAR